MSIHAEDCRADPAMVGTSMSGSATFAALARSAERESSSLAPKWFGARAGMTLLFHENEVADWRFMLDGKMHERPARPGCCCSVSIATAAEPICARCWRHWSSSVQWDFCSNEH